METKKLLHIVLHIAGKHYFYKLSQPDCQTRKPFFVLYDEGQVSGFGLAGFGSFTPHPKTQSYFEDFPGIGTAVRIIDFVIIHPSFPH